MSFKVSEADLRQEAVDRDSAGEHTAPGSIEASELHHLRAEEITQSEQAATGTALAQDLTAAEISLESSQTAEKALCKELEKIIPPCQEHPPVAGELDISIFGKKKKKKKKQTKTEARARKTLKNSIGIDKDLESSAESTGVKLNHSNNPWREARAPPESKPSKACAPSTCVRVLILDDKGCNPGCVRASSKLLRKEKRFEVSVISAADLVKGILEDGNPCQGTVLIIPGGEAVAQRDGLKEAAPMVRRWLCHGGPGGILGVCGGAVVSSADAKRGLGFAPGVHLVNDNVWANAGFAGSVELEWSVANVLAVAGARMCMSYENGPLLKLSQSSGSDSRKSRGRQGGRSDELDGTTEIWATYTSDIATRLAKEDAAALEDATIAGDVRWACVACSTWQRPAVRKCTSCGASRREAEKAGKIRSRLAGQMFGQAAITATTLHHTTTMTEVTNGRREAGTAARVLLFGPHPEFGGKKAGLCKGVLWGAGGSNCSSSRSRSSSSSGSSSSGSSSSSSSSGSSTSSRSSSTCGIDSGRGKTGSK